MAAVLKYWSGSAWVPSKPLKYYTGSVWTTKPLKYWNGSAWIGAATATLLQDNFNRADANLEASPVASGGWSWTHDGAIAGAMQVSVNILRVNTTNAVGSAYFAPALTSANHYVQYKANAGATAVTGAFICARLTDRNNFVGIRSGNGGANGMIEVYRRVGGTSSNLYSSPASTMAAGDIIRLECSGTNFTVKKNGATVAGPTAIGDATLTSAVTGVVGRSNTGNYFDDFEAGIL